MDLNSLVISQVLASQTTLIVADDHPLFRAALREVVGRMLPDSMIIEAESVGKLEEAVQKHSDADLVLLDLRMPGAHGFSALIRLRARHPSIPVAVISADESASVARGAMNLGASGFIPKSASIETIGKMLRALLAGELALPQDYVDPAVKRNRPEHAPERSISSLSPQQLRVLLLLAEGHSNKAIARDLEVSEATIKAHITIILRKLGLERRTQAALLAQRLLDADPPIESTGRSAAPDLA